VAGAAPHAGSLAETVRPRLVVLVSIDQFRADYLVRFQDLYLPPGRDDAPGGFRYLQARGAWYPDCRYEHYRTVTAVGHATLSTGAQPCVHGIVGNSWWDRASGKAVYCVSDPKVAVVGAAGPEAAATGGAAPSGAGMSPANLLVTSLGDELELATGGRSRTVSLSLKDRAAILLAGHRADQAVWFNASAGSWVSSTFYCRDARLPGWAEELNRRHLPDEMKAQPWEPSVDEAALRRVWNPAGGPSSFSHRREGKGYGPFAESPAGNAFLFAGAREAVTAEGLGQDEIPDLLTLNLASNDYVGHRYGPDSAEVLDISVQTDRQLAEFFGFLERTVPGGLSRVTLAICADHGVVTIPEVNAAAGVPAARALVSSMRAAAEKALDDAIGPADWVASLENGEVSFSPAALARYPREPRSRLETLACDALRNVPGVLLAIGKSAVLSGQVPATALGRRISQGVHPSRSGDVIVITDPQWLPGSSLVGTGASHGSPYAYDTHVPLLMGGFGVRRGVYTAPVSPAQIAPTLAYLLGVARPSGAEASLLPGLKDAEK
jgi:predicted AlkP superfamily pyrophosphatase or phosphodiesterase